MAYHKVTPAMRARMRELRPLMLIPDVAVEIEAEFGVSVSAVTVHYHTRGMKGPAYKRTSTFDVKRAIRLLPYMPRSQIAAQLGVSRRTLWRHLKLAGAPGGPAFNWAARKIAA